MTDSRFWSIADYWEVEGPDGQPMIEKEHHFDAMANVVEADHGKYDTAVADVSLLFRGEAPAGYKETVKRLCEVYKSCKPKKDFWSKIRP